MRRCLAIAGLTWKAAFRFRLFWVLTTLLLGSVVVLPLPLKPITTTPYGFAATEGKRKSRFGSEMDLHSASAFGLWRRTREEPDAALLPGLRILVIEVEPGLLGFEKRAVNFHGFANHFGDGTLPGRLLLTRENIH